MKLRRRSIKATKSNGYEYIVWFDCDIKIRGDLLVWSMVINIALSVIRSAQMPEPEPTAFPFWVFREFATSSHLTSLQAYEQSSYEHAVQNIVGHSQHSLACPESQSLRLTVSQLCNLICESQV